MHDLKNLIAQQSLVVRNAASFRHDPEFIDDKFFSRCHAVINREEGGWVLRDLNSTNGTSVHGKAVGTWRLTEGDVIEIGKHRLVFVAGRSREADVGVATQSLDAAVTSD